MDKNLLISRAFNVTRGMFSKKSYGSDSAKYMQPRKVDMDKTGNTLSRAFNVARGIIKK